MHSKPFANAPVGTVVCFPVVVELGERRGAGPATQPVVELHFGNMGKVWNVKGDWGLFALRKIGELKNWQGVLVEAVAAVCLRIKKDWFPS